MKRLLLLVVIIFFCTQIYSQENEVKKVYLGITDAIDSALLTQQGGYEVGGNFSYSDVTTEIEYNNHVYKEVIQILQIDLALSYFVFDNLSFGMLFSYLQQNLDGPTTEQTMVGPVLKKYFGDDRFRPFVFADYLFLTGDNIDGGELDFGAGVLYHIAGNFGISAQLKYGQIFTDFNNIKKQNSLMFGIGIQNFIL